MSERARHLAERVFPEDVRVRQWVLSLPFDLRWRAAFDHALARRLAGLLQVAIARRYRRLAREAGLTDPQGDALLVMQRFSSDLRTSSAAIVQSGADAVSSPTLFDRRGPELVRDAVRPISRSAGSRSRLEDVDGM